MNYKMDMICQRVIDKIAQTKKERLLDEFYVDSVRATFKLIPKMNCAHFQVFVRLEEK